MQPTQTRESESTEVAVKPKVSANIETRRRSVSSVLASEMRDVPSMYADEESPLPDQEAEYDKAFQHDAHGEDDSELSVSNKTFPDTGPTTSKPSGLG